MKKILSLAVATTLASFLAGCDQKPADNATVAPTTIQEPATPVQVKEADKISVTHAKGTAEVKTNPASVVVFDFGTLDTMDTIGVEVTTALPKKNVPHYLQQYVTDKVTDAGSMKQPDLDAIKQLNPDLIVITGRQSKSFDSLNAIAPTLDLSINNKIYLDSFKKNALTIGQIFGKQSEVENGLAALDKKIADVRKKAEASGQKALVLVHYNGKFGASTSNGYASIIHQVLGVKKADENQGDERQAATPDYIAEKNPDVIFIIDRNEAIGEGKIDRSLMDDEKIKATNAFRKGKIIYLTPDLWYLSGGGLESLGLQIDEVDAAIE